MADDRPGAPRLHGRCETKRRILPVNAPHSTYTDRRHAGAELAKQLSHLKGEQKVVVLVNIFGRDTPVELGFEDIQKN